MSRRNNNKRVLRTGNGRPRDTSHRDVRKRKKTNNYSIKNRHQRSKTQNNGKFNKQRKTSGFLVLTVIIALLAFVIGAGIGVSLSLDDGSDNSGDGANFQNVTSEMMNSANTTTTHVSYDKSVDDVDFNKNQTANKNSNKTTTNRKSG